MLTSSVTCLGIFDFHAAQRVAVALRCGRLSIGRLLGLLQLGRQPHTLRLPIGQFQKVVHEGNIHRKYLLKYDDMATVAQFTTGVYVRRAKGSQQSADGRKQRLHSARTQLGAGSHFRAQRVAIEDPADICWTVDGGSRNDRNADDRRGHPEGPGRSRSCYQPIGRRRQQQPSPATGR